MTRVIDILLRISVGGVFIAAGLLKAIHPSAFALDVAHFHLLRDIEVRLLAAFLPYLEIVAGTSVLLGWMRAGGQFMLTVLIAVFLIALVSARVRGLNVSCGCFGHVSGPPAPDVTPAILRDLLLLFGLCLLWLTGRTTQKSVG